MKWTQANPTDRPITWAQAKAHLRLDDDEQRDYVMELVDAAISYAEGKMGRSLSKRAITAVFYNGEPMNLPAGPVISVTSVKDSDDNDVTYTVEHVGNCARLKIYDQYFCCHTSLTVVYQAGYASTAAIPADIRHSLKMLVQHLWDNPSTPAPSELDAFFRLRSWETGVG